MSLEENIRNISQQHFIVRCHTVAQIMISDSMWHLQNYLIKYKKVFVFIFTFEKNI